MLEADLTAGTTSRSVAPAFYLSYTEATWVSPQLNWVSPQLKGELNMAIGTVVRRLGCAFVYDEYGRQMGLIPLMPSDEVQVYTGSTVGVQRAEAVFIYNERGQQVGVVPDVRAVRSIKRY